MNRYTKRRRRNRKEEVWDNQLMMWILLSDLTDSDRTACSKLPQSSESLQDSSSSSDSSGYSSGGYDSDGMNSGDC